jgi:hypothetical protein
VAEPVARAEAGRGIVRAAWVGNALFAVTALPDAAGVSAFKAPALVTAVVLFLVGIGVWLWAFATAVARSAQGDEIVVASLFLMQGDAPRPVRVQLFSALAASVVLAAATGASDAFGILVPMLPLGLIGLWGARYGTFPPRRDAR